MIQYLTPKEINDTKVRLGPSIPGQHGDGGYVCSSIMLEKSCALFTYGVGGDIRYEEDYYAKQKKPAYLFDFTVDHPEVPSEGLLFKKEGLGDGDHCKDFLHHYNQLGITGDVLLKIDIEGNEYDYFSKCDLKNISLITTGIILEVHWLDDLPHREKFINMMKRLSEFFVLTHVHGNNWGGSFDYKVSISKSHFHGYVMPRVFELSFTNKRFCDYITPNITTYPMVGLDLPNNANEVNGDYDLSFLPTELTNDKPVQ